MTRVFDGAILHVAEGLGGIRVSGEKITAQAGALLGRVSSAALEHSLTGLEFAFGIPGSVGGAAVMNAGAYGCPYIDQMKYIVIQLFL